MRKNRTIILVLLSVYLVVCMLPATAHGAWSSGATGTAEFTKILYCKAGKEYYINEKVKTLFYQHDGKTKTKTGERSKVRWRYMKMTDKATKAGKYVYCVEFGTDFRPNGGYKAKNALSDKAFFDNLSPDTQKIIAATLCYGRNGSRKVPISGANDADYYFATQVLIWEAQQKLRVMVKDAQGNTKGTKLVDAHGMSAGHMKKSLKGRSAEKCYDWLEKKINDHLKIHSFAAIKSSAAPTHQLKENTSGTWSLTLADKNKKVSGIISSNPNITVKKSGYNYTFTSKTQIKTPIAIQCTNKMEGGSSQKNLLVWHSSVNASYQAAIMGSVDLFSEYVKLQTVTAPAPKPTTAPTKPSETTKPTEAPKPTEATEPSDVVIKKVEKATGIIRIEKSGEVFHTENNKVRIGTAPLEGITFEIIAAEDIRTADESVVVKKGEVADKIVTNKEGIANSKELYPGKYNIVEKDVPERYIASKTGHPAILEDTGENGEKAFANIRILNRLKTGTVEITKTDVSTGKCLPNTGIEILDENKKVILQGRTDKNGVVKFEKLPTGKYYFREFDAPDGYKIDERPFPFSVKENGEIVKCKMTDEKKKDASPQTGDSRRLWPFFILFGLSAIILVVSRGKGMKS